MFPRYLTTQSSLYAAALRLNNDKKVECSVGRDERHVSKPTR